MFFQIFIFVCTFCSVFKLQKKTVAVLVSYDVFYVVKICIVTYSFILSVCGSCFPSSLELLKTQSHLPSTSSQVKLWLALNFLLLTSFHLYHLPPHLPSPVSNFLPIHSMSASVCQRLYCTPVLLKVLYCKITNVHFLSSVFNVSFV